MKLLYFLLINCSITLAAAQSGIRVIDASTGESIPFANITIDGSQNQVSNAEGYFNLPGNATDQTTFTVSYLGYVGQQVKAADLNRMQNVIRLQPGVFELDDVDVSRVKPDPRQVMAQVRQNLKQNYSLTDNSKDLIFFRQGTSTKPKAFDVEITKSTGFTRRQLEQTNNQITGFSKRLIQSPATEYTDILCNLYRTPATANNAKLEVVKATKLVDQNRSVSLDNLAGSVSKIFFQHVDTTKFYRMKSGWIPVGDTITMNKEYHKMKKAQKAEKKKPEDTRIYNTRVRLANFIKENNFENKKFDFVNDLDAYEYTYDGAMYSAENEFVYVLKFKPKKSRAKYTGTLYVSENDYAIVRSDYQLAKGKTLGGINLKLLLGVKFKQNQANGTLIYAPKPDGKGYYLRYATIHEGAYIYAHRPIKLIELAKSDKDVVAFDIKFEGDSVDKIEFLNISHQPVTEDQFKGMAEAEFDFVKLKKYDPNIWKNYSAIEPLEEMKQFTVVE